MATDEENRGYLTNQSTVQSWRQYRGMVEAASDPLKSLGPARNQVDANQEVEVVSRHSCSTSTTNDMSVRNSGNPGLHGCLKRKRDDEADNICLDELGSLPRPDLTSRDLPRPDPTSRDLPCPDPTSRDGPPPHLTRLGADDCLLHDTVGCLSVDSQGRVASGVSSGGIVLKHDGRVGEAALFGCGCWSMTMTMPSTSMPVHESHSRDSQESGTVRVISVGVSVTGVGEAVVR